MEIRSASAASVVLLLLSLSSILKPPAGARADLITWKCDNGTYYRENSTYQSNVRSLLASLATNVSRSQSLFATAVVGASPDDTVWGLGLCRGDVTNATECASCLDLAPEVAFDKVKCMGVKAVSIFYDRCTIRYSSRDFLTSPDNRQVQSKGASNDSVASHDDADRYDALVVSLVVALANSAAFNTTSRYATGVMVSDKGFTTNTSDDVVHTIYGLVQCTPNQAPGPCRECLQGLTDEMKFNGSIGGHIFGIWCNLRFKKQVFYSGSPMLNLAPPPTPPPSLLLSTTTHGTRWRQHVATVSTIVLGVAVILLSITVVFLWRNKATTQLSYQEDGDDPESLLFDLTTLRRATDNFAQENKLGHGGFGAVYKGVLPHGREIAVKRLDKASGQGLKELRNELLLVAKLKHNNLTKLLGVCLKGEEKLLVYEYLPNRSLDTFLFAPEIEKRLLLRWETRFRIIYGTARGLLYLHEDSQIKIIHRDLKASNILLDTNMNPKISDFGLARLFNSDKPSTTTGQVVGTL